MAHDPRIERFLQQSGLAARGARALPLTGDASDRQYFRVLLRISTVNERRRVDGWVQPRRPMRIQVASASAGHPSYDGVEVDAHGRFEITNLPAGNYSVSVVSPGLSRLWFLPEPGESDDSRLPIATPPFWI